MDATYRYPHVRTFAVDIQGPDSDDGYRNTEHLQTRAHTHPHTYTHTHTLTQAWRSGAQCQRRLGYAGPVVDVGGPQAGEGAAQRRHAQGRAHGQERHRAGCRVAPEALPRDCQGAYVCLSSSKYLRLAKRFDLHVRIYKPEPVQFYIMDVGSMLTNICIYVDTCMYTQKCIHIYLCATSIYPPIYLGFSDKSTFAEVKPRNAGARERFGARKSPKISGEKEPVSIKASVGKLEGGIRIGGRYSNWRAEFKLEDGFPTAGRYPNRRAVLQWEGSIQRNLRCC
jgi:hypothetical protein